MDLSMARTKEKWSGYVSGPFAAVGRHIEIPVTLYEDPDRPVVITVDLSKGERFIRGFSNVLGKALGRLRTDIESPDSFGDGEVEQRNRT